MVNFVSFDDFDNLLARISQDFGLDLVAVLTGNLANFGITKKNILTWSDLQNLDENELFVDSNLENAQKIYLVDFTSLIIDKNSAKFLSDFVTEKNAKNSENSENSPIYLYSQNITTEQKNLLKKHKITIEELKIDPKIRMSLAQEYNKKLNLNLSSFELTQLTFETLSLVEIINKIDFLSLTENPQKNLSEVCKNQEILLFTLALDMNAWKKVVNDDNLQLALSLIFGKLEKKNPKLAKLVIQTDQKIKTRSGIKAILWWKKLLWQLQREL